MAKINDINAVLGNLKEELQRKGQELLISNKINEEKTNLMRRAEFIINAAEEYMTLVNRDYVYEAVNDAYCEAYGMKAEEIIGRTIWEQWGEERGNDIKQFLDKALSGESAQDHNWYEFPAIGKRYFEVCYYPYNCKDGGGVTHVVIVSHDATDRKVAEDKLQETCNELRQKNEELRDVCKVFEEFLFYSPVAIHLKDDQLRILRVSNKYAEKARMSVKDLIGKSNTEIWGEEIGVRLDELDRKVLDTKLPLVAEESIYGERFVSTRFYVEIKGKPRLGGFTMDWPILLSD